MRNWRLTVCAALPLIACLSAQRAGSATGGSQSAATAGKVRAGQEVERVPPSAKPVHSPRGRVLTLGMTREELLKTFGSASRCYVPKTYKHFPSAECAAARGVWDIVVDVYNRKTKANEYEIRVGYGADARQSRLHPQVRLGRFDFFVDRLMTAQELLADIPEIAAWCSSGCRIVGVPYPSPELMLYVEAPTSEQRQLAALAASTGIPYKGDHDWMPAATLIPEDGAKLPASKEEWFGLRIKQVIFSATEAGFQGQHEKYVSLGLTRTKLQDLGRFSPSR